MQPSKIERAAKKIYGDLWREPLARDMNVHRTTVMRWHAGKVPVPEAVFVALKCMETCK